MKRWVALVLLVTIVVPNYAAGERLTDDVDSTDDSSGNATMPLNVTKPMYFTDTWRAIFSLPQLKNQAKWRLAEKQPEDGSYQTRIYPTQWWSTSHTPCQSSVLATGSQYMKLYFFFNGFNYQKQKYPLTYPNLFEVDKRPKPTMLPKTTPKRKRPTQRRPGAGKRGGKRRGKRGGKRTRPKPKKVCPVTYTTYFYLPISLKKWAPKSQENTINSFKMPADIYYVRGYSGNYTTAYCEEQGQQLAMDLLRNNVWTWNTYWLCAKYEQPMGQTEQIYEVWMRQRLHE